MIKVAFVKPAEHRGQFLTDKVIDDQIGDGHGQCRKDSKRPNREAFAKGFLFTEQTGHDANNDKRNENPPYKVQESNFMCDKITNCS
jgi:hypothetical protein